MKSGVLVSDDRIKQKNFSGVLPPRGLEPSFVSLPAELGSFPALAGAWFGAQSSRRRKRFGFVCGW